MSISYEPIGIIRTGFKSLHGIPIQTAFSNASGKVEIHEQYTEGLKDLEGFSHIILIYHFHKSTGYRLIVKPYLDDAERGLFATRAPKRPNPIGVSIVRLDRVDGNRLYVTGVDILDGTPLLDIKPYVPCMDGREDCRIGWLEGKLDRRERHTSDGRFA